MENFLTYGAIGLALVSLPLAISAFWSHTVKKGMTDGSPDSSWSEERFKDLVNMLPEAIFEADCDLSLTFANQRAIELFGYSDEEVKRGLNGLDMIDPKDRDHARAMITKRLEGANIGTMEYLGLRKDGSTFPILFHASSVVKDGKVTGIRGVILDITERKRVEEQLRHSAEIIRRSPAVAFVWHNADSWPVDFVSDNASELFGYSVDDFCTRRVSYESVIHPEDLERVIGEVNDGSISKEKRDFEHEPYRIITKAGQTKWVDDRTSVIRNDRGELTHYQGIVIDITDRMVAEEKLRESKAKFERITDRIYDVIFVVDLTGKLSYISPSVTRAFGYKPEELVGRRISELVPESEIQLSIDSLQSCADGNNVERLSTEFIKKDGSLASIELNAVPIFEDGKVVGAQAILRDVTERKQALGALRASEERFRTQMIQSPIVMEIYDLNGLQIEVNRAYEELWGFPASTTVNKFNVLKSKEVEDTGLIIYVKRAYAGEAVTVPEYVFDPTGVTESGGLGRKRWLSTKIYPLRDSSGDVSHIVITHEDITERINAQKALRKSEFKLLEAQRIAKLGHYVLDVATGIWTASTALEDIMGIGKDYKKDVAGWLQLVHPDYRELMSNYLKDDILAQHRDFNKEYMIVDAATGQEKWVHGLGNLRFDNDNNVIEMFGTIQDITVRKIAERALRSSERKFKSITQRIYDVVISVLLDGTITFVSPSIVRVFGHQPEEMIGRIMTEYLPESEIANARETFQICASGRNVEGYHSEIIKKDDSIAFIELNAVPIIEDSKVVGVQAIIRDITETKRLQELESRAERLETAGTIAGQVAHDFNNLLAPMMAYPGFIREELPRNHPTLKYLDQIETAAQKIADINQDLLTMGRRGHYNQTVLNLNAVVQQALTDLKLDNRTLVCELDLSENLLDILGGNAQLHRMISNLLHNAIDAMNNIGQITVKTENYYVERVSPDCRQVPKGEYVKLTVTDTGCGMTEDVMRKIFEPFFTSKTADKKRGSGLGMSVVDAVIKDHNGYIDFGTKVGVGTSFYIYFPITRESVDSPGAMESNGGSELILVVDDDDIQRAVSSQLLTKLGYETSSVSSGEKAVEFLRENPHDLIMLDMIMPDGIDGTETYRRILEFYPHQKAIILSGFSESDRVLEVQKLGAGTFVKKPVTRQIIASAVRAELDRRRKLTD